MRTAILVSALAGLVAATPMPQSMDFGEIDAAKDLPVGPAVTALSEPPTYDAASASASAAKEASTDPATTKLRKRDACSPQPDGYGPKTTDPDTAEAFLANPAYSNIANGAATPQGYSLSFVDLHGSTESPTYMGLYTLEKYDTIKCQQLCDAAQYCSGINIYIERDPSVDPGTGCDDPPSIANYKCTLFGAHVTEASATNLGGYRDNFHVVIAASNGYSKNAPPPSYTNFDGPVPFGGAINAPSSYMGVKYYPGVYDPSQCAASCQETTAYDHDHPTDGHYDACNFFNSYVLSINNVPQGTYCTMYTQPWDRSYSTNYGQYRGDDYYSVSQSYGYTLTVQDSGTI
ncbi:hypothetical protein MMC24_006771 [Lignoscripta atroalba]|nr:hypothetical protein [Lignoscripta atroalba]